jgi:hypothetical protein
MTAEPRSPVPCLLHAGLVVVLGLASRRFREDLPPFVASYAGDALWAAMVFFLAAALWPRGSGRTLAAGALLFAFSIEFSQLYRAPWIDAIRGTTLGALVLGHGFLWSDLLCYTAGIGVAAGIDHRLRHRRP